jgi:hypothetical protein
LLRPFEAQISFSTPYFWILLAYILPLMSEAKFHTHANKTANYSSACINIFVFRQHTHTHKDLDRIVRGIPGIRSCKFYRNGLETSSLEN